MSDPVASAADTELLARVEQVLAQTFELDQEIGRGGMGIVYLARDRRLKRPVAIKVLPPELSFRVRHPVALSSRGRDSGAAVASQHRSDLHGR